MLFLGNLCASRNVESFKDDFRECSGPTTNTNKITTDNELICYNATTKFDVESKFIWLKFDISFLLTYVDLVNIHYIGSHCAFSSNLFHGQIVEIAILQLSDSKM